jgi:ribonuclease E
MTEADSTRSEGAGLLGRRGETQELAFSEGVVARSLGSEGVVTRSLGSEGVVARSLGSEGIERVVKPQLIKSPRETEPPEVIAIEMTPEEQDVYALMGISPLIRLDREIKNPKSVILSVVLPGESNRTETSNVAAVESLSEAPRFSELSEHSEEAEVSEPARMTSPAGAWATEEAGTSEPRRVTSYTEAEATEIATDPTDISELDSSRPVIRRRRRRSSAIEGEDSTAW